MKLQRLELFNFRNHEHSVFEFEESVVAFTGPNGVGKTNILDAIHVLSLSRSYFTNQDSQCINFDSAFAVVKASLQTEERLHAIDCKLTKGGKKVLRLNHSDYEKISDHLGLMPVVMITPFDISLVHDGGSERRKFLDTILTQCDKEYLQDLQQYKRCIEQKAALLKSSTPYTEMLASLDAWNHKIAMLSKLIFKKRQELGAELSVLFSDFYSKITGSSEEAVLSYVSQLHDNEIERLLFDNMQREISSARCLFGVHKDDLQLLVKGQQVKDYGSQGQVKSVTIALKLAQFEYLSRHTGKRPLMLLDDIFEKLDEQRAARLMELISENNASSVIITDTHEKRVRDFFERIHKKVTYFAL